MRNAKIVCTIGPGSESYESLHGLAEAGMDVVRLNASHGSTESRERVVERIREVESDLGSPIPVMLDLAGPEVRTAPLEGSIELTAGTAVRLAPGEEATPTDVGLSHSIAACGPGDRVLLDDGRIELTVRGVEGETVEARVENGGTLGGRKGVNVPGVDLELPTVTERDRRVLEAGVGMGVDLLAASFVGSGADVYEVGRHVDDLGGDLPIVAKIERASAVENLEGIVEEAYGVMVARGDLGVECPLEEVPLIQKRIIRACHRAGVPVITATEMLDSMVHERRPTRAEASDVANAVLDGTDAVMLSAETAIGDHPVRVVGTMDRIVRDIEASEEYDGAREQRVPPTDETRTDALARSARFLARDVDASAVVAATESGYTALKAANYRPDVPVVAATLDDRVCRRLALSWGIRPVSIPYATGGADALIRSAAQAALDVDAAESGETVVVLSGMVTEREDLDTANTLKLHVAAETLTTGRSVVEGVVSGPVARAEDGDLSGIPEGTVLAVSEGFDAEFEGDLSRIAGVVDANEGVTGYAAILARELGVPMISEAELPAGVGDGDIVTLDAERGVVYAGAVGNPAAGDRRFER